LIKSGKAKELEDPKFRSYPKKKQNDILQKVRNRISAQNSRNRKRNQFNVIKKENENLLTENQKLRHQLEKL